MSSGTLCKQVKASYALSKTILPDLDYSLNPYFGCGFGCVYCYARKFFFMRNIPHQWGEYVEAKVNLPSLLTKQLMGVPERSTIGVGTATDPYQPFEAEHRLTRRALNILRSRQDLEIDIQTKSTLILRDVELLASCDTVSVGFTILTADDARARIVES
ncbi:MAG: radical SAM protein, partial [Nitrososphaeria archaeon]|nr:radical SAM protein [Nitrososphaeria archaeon]NIN51813.1 radical SAM protein [Nitrososphaeria archaeon]NIQ32348.1 radical SAM protein [Nitrososphaeria archaeon]